MQKAVDLIYDYLDEAAMTLYQELQIDYLDCLIRVADDIVKGIDESRLTEDALDKLTQIYQDFSMHSFVNEEIRIAMELLIIKGFKHRGLYSGDLITPDAVSYIFAYIINILGEENSTILDVRLGTGNLINAISNFVSFAVNLIGIDADATLCELARVASDLQNNNITIYCNNYLDKIYDACDIVIGDLDNEFVEDKYIPYEVIKKYYNNLNDDGFFIYLIPNDFFNQVGVNKFKSEFPGTLAGIIVLPDTMFNDKHIGKSILIGCKKHLEAKDVLLVNFPSLNDQAKVKETIVMIDEWIKKLKGMIV